MEASVRYQQGKIICRIYASNEAEKIMLAIIGKSKPKIEWVAEPWTGGEECNGNEPMNSMQFSVEMSELFARKP